MNLQVEELKKKIAALSINPADENLDFALDEFKRKQAAKGEIRKISKNQKEEVKKQPPPKKV